ISIRRARLAAETAPTLLDDERQVELRAILDWLGTTRDGTLSDLSFRPSAEVWEEVASESDVCLRAKCPHFEECYYQRARREAASADILVANHHLLFSDLAVRRAQGNYTAPAVLPHYRRLILDEAHNLEEAASRHMGATTSRRALYRVLRRLENRGRGILPSLRRTLETGRRDLLAQAAVDLLDERLLPSLEGARERAGGVFGVLGDLRRRQPDSTRRLEPEYGAGPDWEMGLEEELAGLLLQLDTLLQGVEALRERIALDEEARAGLEPQLLELRGVASRLEGAAYALRATLRPAEDALSMVRWLEVRRDPRGGESNVILSAVPLDLSQVLRET